MVPAITPKLRMGTCCLNLSGGFFLKVLNQTVQMPAGFLQIRNGITLVETSPGAPQYFRTVMIQTAPVADHCIYCVDAHNLPLGVMPGLKSFIHMLTFMAILRDDLGNFMVGENTILGSNPRPVYTYYLSTGGSALTGKLPVAATH